MRRAIGVCGDVPYLARGGSKGDDRDVLDVDPAPPRLRRRRCGVRSQHLPARAPGGDGGGLEGADPRRRVGRERRRRPDVTGAASCSCSPSTTGARWNSSSASTGAVGGADLSASRQPRGSSPRRSASVAGRPRHRRRSVSASSSTTCTAARRSHGAAHRGRRRLGVRAQRSGGPRVGARRLAPSTGRRPPTT